MVSKNKLRNTGCPIAFALDAFGDRWSLLIVRDMLVRGFQKYNEFLSSDESIATNVLTNRLRELEGLGIITRSKDENNKRSVIYQLTEKGLDLTPLIVEMVSWSAEYDIDTKAREDILEKIRKDKEGLIKQLKDTRRNSYVTGSNS